MSQACNPTQRSEQGYALLVTLVMLALLGVILTGLARRSADTALQARDEEQAARQRWAELSCAHTLLTTASERADRRLTNRQAEQQGDTPADLQNDTPLPSRETFVIQLPGLELRGRIDDEQAKVNLNRHLLASASGDGVFLPQHVADRVIGSSRTTKLQLTRPAFTQALGLKPVESWQQVLPNDGPAELLGIARPEQLTDTRRTPSVADRITLWGDGRINIWTATDTTLREQAAAHPNLRVETMDALIELRTADPTHALGTLIANATEDRDEQALLQRMLTDRSESHAMWLAVRSSREGDARDHWSLWVAESQGGQETGRLRQFRW